LAPAGAAWAQKERAAPQAQGGGASKDPAPAGADCRSSAGARVALRAADAANVPPLQPDRAVCVRLQRGQSAFFRVGAEAGQYYSIATRRLGRDTDTVLALLNAQG